MYFGLTYLSLGLLAFFLPTRDLSELIMRSIFIAIGIMMLLTQKFPKVNKAVLIAGISVISFWLIFALSLIISHWDDVFHKIHLFYLPLWLFFAIEHFKALKRG